MSTYVDQGSISLHAVQQLWLPDSSRTARRFCNLDVPTCIPNYTESALSECLAGQVRALRALKPGSDADAVQALIDAVEAGMSR